MERFKLKISEKIGDISGIWTKAESANCCMLLAHGAGAGILHPFMGDLANALAELQITTLRFNFPYMEQGKRRPDYPVVIHSTFLSILEKISPTILMPLIIGGKSFGGRMGSQVAAKFNPSEVAGLVFYGFPLHAPGKPGIERADHLSKIKIPMLFLQGDRDALAKPDLVEHVISKLPTAQMHFYNGANHSFSYPKKMNISREVIFSSLSQHTRDFIDTAILKKNKGLE